MATATEMTLALGRTVYGGDQSGEAASDAKIAGRETRLSVTWRLSEEEQDLTLMASVLAEEAERALKQADRTVHKVANLAASTCIERCPDAEWRPDVGSKPGSETITEQRQPITGAPAEGAHAENGQTTDSGNQPASFYSPTGSRQAIFSQNGGKAPMTNGSSGNGSSRYPAYVAPITKPQQLAIQSHCARHGVADWELRRLLWEMFGKKEPRELNKDQAAELLTALQRDILSSAAESSAYAN